jgi:indoleamine 2,3-dioxygenase
MATATAGAFSLPRLPSPCTNALKCMLFHILSTMFPSTTALTVYSLDIPPFMSYAAAYSLYNYTLASPAHGMDYSNLRLIRAFEKGLDPTSSEAGFVLTHVDMVKESHALVRGAVTAIESTHDRETFNAGLGDIIAGMQKVESSMEVMWANSKPAEYLSFRTFIFGITSQSMFPNGVVYQGIRNDEPLFFRGESGANDSMIPLLDGLLQIPFPPTPLTKILHEFRSYRPKPHRDFLAWVREAAEEVGVKDFATKDRESGVLYLRLLDHVRSFRWRHWLFAREYIIRRTPHPTATGGSPIVTVCLPKSNPFLLEETKLIIPLITVASQSAIRCS